MKQGKRIIIPVPVAGFPVVQVGDEERGVIVLLGTMTIYLINTADGNTVIVRAVAYDEHGHSLPVESRGATDVRNQVEYTVQANGG